MNRIDGRGSHSNSARASLLVTALGIGWSILAVLLAIIGRDPKRDDRRRLRAGVGTPPFPRWEPSPRTKPVWRTFARYIAARPTLAREAAPFIAIAAGVLVLGAVVPLIWARFGGTTPAKAGAAVAFLTPGKTDAKTASSDRVALSAIRPITRRPIAATREVYADGLSYSSQWEAVRGRNDGRARGMSERTFVAGATASLAFTGHGITVYGVRGIKGGAAAISIDGVVRAPHASFDASVKRTHVPIFTTDRLADGPHTLAITVLPATRRGYVNVESAEIRP